MDSEEEDEKVHQKRNPDTDAGNFQFEEILRKRRESDVTNFKYLNREYVRSLNSGRPLQPRIDIPDNVDKAMFS